MSRDERPYPTSTLSGVGGFGGGLGSSPFLNYDPKIISPGANDSQWIFPDGAINKPSRGRFEMAFSQIGGSVFTGAAVGGAYGMVNGVKATSSMVTGAQAMSSSVRRTQLLNYVVKNGGNAANAFGVVAVLYSIIGVGLSFASDHDDVNSVVAGASTGLIYGAASNPRPRGADATAIVKIGRNQRLRRSLIGSLIGTALTCSYVLFFNKEKYLK